MLHSHLVASNVEAEDAGVPVEAVESLELVRATDLHFARHGIDDAISREVARHQASTCDIVADDGLHEHEGHGIWAPPRHALPPSSNVCCFAHLVVSVDQLGSTEIRLSGCWLRSA